MVVVVVVVMVVVAAAAAAVVEAVVGGFQVHVFIDLETLIVATLTRCILT